MSDEYMCPFCVTPWKCNGPHIEPEDMNEFEAYSRSQYDFGFFDGLDAARDAIAKIPREDGGYFHVLHACDVEAAIDDLREAKQ